MTEGDKWYGSTRKGKTETFKLLRSNPEELFDLLSSGRRDMEKESVNAEIPDLRQLMLKYARSRLKFSLGKDWNLVKIFNVYNAMDEIINLLFEKSMSLGLIAGESQDPEKFFQNLSLNSNSALSAIGNLGVQMHEKRRELERSLNSMVGEIFPNTSRILNPILCAELLSHFSTLERLVNTPSSSIQMAGAEKSLFISKTRHIKNPKHGFIFKSHLVSGSPPGRRGKVARRLASKIALTLKADGYGRIMSEEEIESILSKITL
ncbi:MAG: NOP5/NOP56 family protein [Cuniculiplasma sp.]